MSDSPSSATAVLPEATPCPVCGYDLRATTSGTCPECGAKVHRDDLSRSKLPWRYRHELGTRPAAARTLWLLLRRPWLLLGELPTKPEKPDAEAYAWPVRIITVLAAAGLARTGLDPNQAANLIYPNAGPPDIPVVNDLLAPLWTAVTVLGVWPLIATAMLLAWLLPMSLRAAFTRSRDPDTDAKAQVGVILTRYLESNVAVFVLTTWGALAMARLHVQSGGRVSMPSMFLPLLASFACIAVWTSIGTMLTWVRLVWRCSPQDGAAFVWRLIWWLAALMACAITTAMLGCWLPGLLTIYGAVVFG